MFTGIIETLGKVEDLSTEGTNLHLTISSAITEELKIDQSVSHNGVCLTVVSKDGDKYTVTAIKETCDRSNIGNLKQGDEVNLERAMLANARFDGHFVQGHVDGLSTCISIENENGSWLFTFSYSDSEEMMFVDKGSVTINGVSLTVINPHDNKFSVAIIPYTFEHTNFKNIAIGDTINLEFDVVGKYINKQAKFYLQNLVKENLINLK